MSPPWQYSQGLGGEYVYNPTTDVITLRSGRSFRRPDAVPRANLRAAIYQGPFDFQFQDHAAERGYHHQAPPGQSGQLKARQAQAGQLHAGQIQADQVQARQLQARQVQAGQLQAGQVPSGQGQPTHTQQIGQGQYRAANPQQPRNVPSGSGTQELEQNMARMNLRPGEAVNQVRTRNVQSNGANLLHTADPRTQVQQLVQDSPPTPRDLQADGITLRRSLLGTGGNAERLYPEYVVRPARFFGVGRVFLVLWAEPAGGNNTVITVQVPGTVLNHMGERVFSKVRRFVVIRESANYCSALPITTYSGRGVSKPGVVKSEHAIIYTGRNPPQAHQSERPARGESGMRPEAIRVDPDSATDRLDPMSRIDFGGVHQVQHNIKTKSLGVVSRQSVSALQSQFRNVWQEQLRSRSGVRGQPQTQNRAGMVAGGVAGATAAFAAGAAAATANDDDDDDDEDDEEEENAGEDDDDDDGEGEDDDEEEEDDDEDGDEDDEEDSDDE